MVRNSLFEQSVWSNASLDHGGRRPAPAGRQVGSADHADRYALEWDDATDGPLPNLDE